MRLSRQSGISIFAELLWVLVLALPASAGDLLSNTLETGENLVSGEPLAVLCFGAPVSVAVHLVESSGNSRGFLPESPYSGMDRVDDFVFGPVLPLSSAGVWLLGSAAGERGVENTGEELCRGLLWTYGITAGLKYTAGRTRPDGSDNLSFPSAHAAGASCAAAVLWSRYGASAGIPMAAAAVYTCVSRVNLGRHFPSDVLAGAVIGTACGLAASLSENDEHRDIGFSLCFSIDSQGRMFSSPW